MPVGIETSGDKEGCKKCQFEDLLCTNGHGNTRARGRPQNKSALDLGREGERD